MKHKILLSIISILAISSLSAQNTFEDAHKATKKKIANKSSTKRRINVMQIGIGYEFSSPLGAMQNGMSPLHSLNLFGEIPIKKTIPNFTIGANINVGYYALKGYTLDYSDNGNRVNSEITFRSSIIQFGLNSSYYFINDKKTIPFVTIRSGYAIVRSDFIFGHPLTHDACRNLGNDLISDGTFYWGIGGGLRFPLKTRDSRFPKYLDFGLNIVNGTRIEYVNVSKLQNQNAPMTTSTNPDVKPVNANFINATTGVSHQHQIAEIFSNKYSLLQLRLSYVMSFRY